MILVTDVFLAAWVWYAIVLYCAGWDEARNLVLHGCAPIELARLILPLNLVF